MRRLLLILLLALSAQACGSKGSLYLPPPDAQQPSDQKQKSR